MKTGCWEEHLLHSFKGWHTITSLNSNCTRGVEEQKVCSEEKFIVIHSAERTVDLHLKHKSVLFCGISSAQRNQLGVVSDTLNWPKSATYYDAPLPRSLDWLKELERLHFHNDVWCTAQHSMHYGHGFVFSWISCSDTAV